MTIRWPEDVLRPQNVSFNIAPRSLAGPTSVSGVTQIVASDAGLWKITFGSIIVKDRAAVITHRAISTLLEGRLQPILVPFCRAYQPASAVGTADGLYDEVPHSDDAFFDDDTGYVGGSTEVVSAAMDARAVSGAVTIAYGGPIEPGQVFSIGERAYRLRTVVYTGTNTANITFRPPLREAAPYGTFLNFDDPIVRCRLASDDSMDLELALRRFATPTVQFVEDL